MRADFTATRDFLVRKGVTSYLSPLSNILKEFFLMRDAYIYSQTRLNELDRILQQISAIRKTFLAAEKSCE